MQIQHLNHYIRQQMKQTNLPGLAIAITDRERTLHLSVHGYADAAARDPVTPNTLFEIGSISKSFTTIALMQLWQAGRLDLNAPVQQYLPWFVYRSDFGPVTTAHLMTHTAGLPNTNDDIPASLYQAFFAREHSVPYPLGSHYHYSNVAYQVLGFLLEALTGKSYAEAIQTAIVAPLAMTATEPVITNEIRPRMAVGYENYYDDRPSPPGRPLTPAPWFEYGAGDGSIASTPADMAAYARMILARGGGPEGPILSEEAFARLVEPAVASGPNSHYGYGLFTRETEGRKLIGHSGGMVGYRSMLLTDAEAGLAAVVLVNGPGAPGLVAEFALKVARAALDGAPLPEVPPEPQPLGTENAQEYAGLFSGQAGRLRLAAEPDRLVLNLADGPVALEPRGRDRFYVNHPDFTRYLLTFGREEGRVTEAFFGPHWYPADAYKGPQSFECPAAWLAYPGHYRTQQPWMTNFRIILRKGRLFLLHAHGGEEPLIPLTDDLFQVGEAQTPERMRFDTQVNRQTLRASLSGCLYYRALTP